MRLSEGAVVWVLEGMRGVGGGRGGKASVGVLVVFVWGKSGKFVDVFASSLNKAGARLR